ncbi:MAG: hypothetical protein ABFD94_11545 [Armatimonadia bacterium]
MKRALRIAVSPGYTKSAQAGISAEDAARYEAAIEAKDAALDACTKAMDEALNALLDYVETLEKQGGTMNYGRKVMGQLISALAAARKARKL